MQCLIGDYIRGEGIRLNFMEIFMLGLGMLRKMLKAARKTEFE